jgi:hypothetical protein
MVGADLERLVTPHDQPSLVADLVLQQPDVAGAALLPLAALAVKFEQLGAHLEGDVLGLLVGLGLDLFCEVDDGLEVGVGLVVLGIFFLGIVRSPNDDNGG